MMVIFCPNCQNRLEVPEEFSGEKLQCPYCEVKFIIESEEETLPKIVETAPVIAQAVEPGYLDSQLPGCMEINWIRIVQK